MGYRQNNKCQQKQWLKKNAHRLNALGIPSELTDDERHFWYALPHGEAFFISWCHEDIEERHALPLIALLKQIPELEGPTDLQRWLEVRVGLRKNWGDDYTSDKH